MHLINKEKPDIGIIFCNTRRDVTSVSNNLKRNDVNVGSLHGGMPQNRREAVMDMFHKGKFKFLVATDVAARGLDINNVSHIFNYSIPRDSEDYANRIGRTARAGKTGKAISLLTREDHPLFSRIIRLFDYNIEKMRVENIERVSFKIESPRRDSGGFGRSRSGSRGGSRSGSRSGRSSSRSGSRSGSKFGRGAKSGGRKSFGSKKSSF